MPSSEVMGKWKAGTLHSGGPGGPKVGSQKQAVAIMMSEKRKEQAHGGTYPEHAGGGTVYAKGSEPKQAAYAQGGAVLPRSGDWKKTVPNKGFMTMKDEFRDPDEGDARADEDQKYAKSGEGAGTGMVKPPKQAYKSEKPIKPRG